MGIGSGTAIALSAGLGAAGTATSAILGSQAAGTQASAANNAAGLQYLSGQNALNFEQQVFNQQQANQAPFIGAGQGAVSELSNLLGVTPTNPTLVNQGASVPSGYTSASLNPNALNYLATGQGNPQAVPSSTAQLRGGTGKPTGQIGPMAGAQSITPTNVGGVNYNFPTGGGNSTGSLLQPWTQQFQAPTAAQAEQTPGYQFALQQGELALQNSAAAQGNIFSGGTLKSLNNYAQNAADTNYQQVYNNALTQYQQAYNQFQNNQSNTYNRLASLAGFGQTSTAQLANSGSQAANNVSNTLLNTGAQVGQNINNAGAANASGYSSIANSLNSGLGNLGNLATLAGLYGNLGPGASAATSTPLGLQQTIWGS